MRRPFIVMEANPKKFPQANQARRPGSLRFPALAEGAGLSRRSSARKPPAAGLCFTRCKLRPASSSRQAPARSAPQQCLELPEPLMNRPMALILHRVIQADDALAHRREHRSPARLPAALADALTAAETGGSATSRASRPSCKPFPCGWPPRAGCRFPRSTRATGLGLAPMPRPGRTSLAAAAAPSSGETTRFFFRITPGEKMASSLGRMPTFSATHTDEERTT